MPKKHIIKDLTSLKAYSKTISTPIIGIGARPFHATVGLHNIFPTYELIVCKGTTKDAPLLERKMKITYLNNDRNSFKNVKNYVNYPVLMPSDVLRDTKVVNYLNSFKERPALLFFKLSPSLEELAASQKYITVGSSYATHKKYENKINFQALLNQLTIVSPKHIIVDAKTLDYDKIEACLGAHFVIQLPSIESGSGTFFIKKKDDFLRIIEKDAIKEAVTKNTSLKITSFIDSTCSPSMTVCVTKFGIVHTNLQKQLIDIPEVIENDRRSGVYCGHDWSESSFHKNIEKQASDIARKIGNYLKEKEGFRGIFGIDFVLEKNTNKLYPIESNIRLLGSFPMLSMVQESADQPLIQALQVLDSLPLDNYTFDVEALNQEMSPHKSGAQLNIHNRDNNLVYVSGDLNPGIYKIEPTTDKVIYLREGVLFEDLQNKDEFLISGSIPKIGRVYARHQAICKIISPRSLTTAAGNLNSFAKNVVRYTYDALALKKIP